MTRFSGISILLALLICVYTLTNAGRFHTIDEVSLFAVTESVALRNSVEINSIAWTQWLEGPGEVLGAIGPTGDVYSQKGPAPAFLAVPWYSLLRFVARFPVEFGVLQGTLLWNGFVTALTAGLLWLTALRLGYSDRTGALLGLLFGLCTIAWPYANHFFGEPLSALSLLVCYYGIISWQRTRSAHWVWLAAVGGGVAITTVTAHLALVAILTFYFFFYEFRLLRNPALLSSTRRTQIKLPGESPSNPALSAFYLVAPMALAGVLLMWYNYVRFGDFFESGAHFANGEGFTNPLWQGAWGLLISPYRGVFWHTPLFIASLFTFLPFWRRHRGDAHVIAGLSLVLIVLYSLWWVWWGGIAWGPRFLTPLAPFWVLLLAPIFEPAAKTPKPAPSQPLLSKSRTVVTDRTRLLEAKGFPAQEGRSDPSIATAGFEAEPLPPSLAQFEEPKTGQYRVMQESEWLSNRPDVDFPGVGPAPQALVPPDAPIEAVVTAAPPPDAKVNLLAILLSPMALIVFLLALFSFGVQTLAVTVDYVNYEAELRARLSSNGGDPLGFGPLAQNLSDWRASPVIGQWRLLRSDFAGNSDLSWLRTDAIVQWDVKWLVLLVGVAALATLSWLLLQWWRHQARSYIEPPGAPLLLLTYLIPVTMIGVWLAGAADDPRYGVVGEGPRLLLAELCQRLTPGDAVITVAPTTYHILMNWQGQDCSGGIPWYGYATKSALQPETQQVLQRLERDSERIWLITGGLQPNDPENSLERWLADHAFKADDRWFADFRLLTYAMPARLVGSPSLPHNTLLTDNNGQTDGANQQVTVISSQAPVRAAPGDVLPVEIQFLLEKEVSEEMRWFVQLLDTQGLPVALLDSGPDDNYTSFTTLAVGKLQVERAALQLPATLVPGQYRLIAGLYKPSAPTAPRLFGPDGRDFVLLSFVTVE